MTQPLIFLATSFASIADQEVESVRLVGNSDREGAGHYGHLPPNPDQLGGKFNFSDLSGRAVTEADFKGHWTLLYFGYARCTDSCPMAIPAIAQAARLLRSSGVSARASFVDIEAPAMGNIRRRAVGDARHQVHLHEVDRNRALRNLQASFNSDLQILTGTRGQLSAAATAFRVAREHTPPRAGEHDHSINHSSLIYLLNPRTKVAGYGYHTTPAAALAETVQRLRRVRS